MMECTLCSEVVHPSCITDVGVDGYIKPQVPNSWECPKCVKSGKAVKLEPPPLTPSGVPTSTASGDGPTPSKLIKTESEEDDKKVMAYGGDSTYGGHQLFSVRGRSDQPKHELRTQLAGQILSASTRQHRQPQFVFRPPPQTLSAEEIYERRQTETVDLKTERGIMMSVFRLLDTTDLASVAVTCKAWCRLAQDPKLWNTVRLTQKRVTSHLLSLVVQRQPLRLYMDFCSLGRQQLAWLLPRLPQTRTLSLVGLEYHSSIVAMGTVNCPMLHELDLSYVTSFNDVALHKLLSSPKDSRPG